MRGSAPRRCATALAFLVGLTLSSTASAQPETALAQAKDASDRGKRHYDLAEYDAAIGEFKRAYLLVPSAGVLFNLAQTYRHSGDCLSAVETYATFLRNNANPAARQIAEEQLTALRSCADERRAAARAEALAQAQAAARARPRRARPTKPPVAAPGSRGSSGLRGTGIVVAIAGGLLVGGAAYFGLDAMQAADELEAGYARGAAWSDLAAIDDRGHRSQTLALGLGISGGAAIIGGTVLYLLGRPETSSRELVVAASPSASGADVHIGWRF